MSPEIAKANENIFKYIVFVPFRLVSLDSIFRYNNHWCKRYTYAMYGKKSHSSIIVFEEKTFDIEKISHILNPDIVVGALRFNLYSQRYE